MDWTISDSKQGRPGLLQVSVRSTVYRLAIVPHSTWLA